MKKNHFSTDSFLIFIKNQRVLENKLATFAFYNVENFYAKKSINQESFLPSNYAKWIDNRYDVKVDRIAHAISKIGLKDTQDLPFFVGLCEVEDESVLNDIIRNDRLSDANYDYIFKESLDERKINVCCLYRKDKIKIIESDPIRVVFKDLNNIKSYTRDILYVKAELEKSLFHCFIVHLPSKLDQEVNQEKRKILLGKIRLKINSILEEDPEAKIMVMGDFNDTPTADNIRIELDTRACVDEVKSTQLYNPMVGLMSYKRGSLVHRKQWMLFDQILFSKGFLTNFSNLEFVKTDIFDASFLSTNIGKLGAFPSRTFIGSKYLGGYSDHFPVFAIIKY